MKEKNIYKNGDDDDEDDDERHGSNNMSQTWYITGP